MTKNPNNNSENFKYFRKHIKLLQFYVESMSGNFEIAASLDFDTIQVVYHWNGMRHTIFHPS